MGSAAADTQTKPTDKTPTPAQHQSNDSVWTSVSQQISAPGSNSDASRHAAATNESKPLPSGFPTNLEITGLNAHDATAVKGGHGSKGDVHTGGDVSAAHSGDA